MSGKPLTVAIAGAGLGGLALAGFINKYSETVVVNIYEKRPDASAPVGEVISFWKRSWEVLRDLVGESEITARGFRLPREESVSGPVFRKADNAAGGFDFHNHMMPYGPLTIPRPDLAQILVNQLNSQTKIHTSKEVASYTFNQPAGVTIHFADGTEEKCDILIGADGVKSNIRASLFEQKAGSADEAQAKVYRNCIRPKWDGSVAYRTFLKYDVLKAEYPNHEALRSPKIWCGKNKHIVSIPVPPRNAIQLICYVNIGSPAETTYNGPWLEEVAADEVQKAYEGWEADVGSMLKHIIAPRRWAIHVVEPLPFWTDGPVALIGDAAHAMATHQGVGGGQAIEDAYLLGRLIAHEKTTTVNAPKILMLYQETRLPQANAAAEKSRVNGLIYDFMHPDYTFSADATAAELNVLGEKVGQSFEWLAVGGCYDEWNDASAYVAEKL